MSTDHHWNANYNHNMTSPHTCEMDNYQKDKKEMLATVCIQWNLWAVDETVSIQPLWKTIQNQDYDPQVFH